MGILALFRRPRPASPVVAASPRTLRPTMHDGPDVTVVDDSCYQPELEQICGGKCSHRYYLPVIAELREEPHDSLDRVAVLVQGLKVGYLSPADTSRYRPAVDRSVREHGVAACTARIVDGSNSDADNGGNFHVVLQVATR